MFRSTPRRGQGLGEYGLILALVAVIAIVGVNVFGDQLASTFGNINSGMAVNPGDGGSETVPPLAVQLLYSTDPTTTAILSSEGTTDIISVQVSAPMDANNNDPSALWAAVKSAYQTLYGESVPGTYTEPLPGGVDVDGDGFHDLWQDGDIQIELYGAGTLTTQSWFDGGSFCTTPGAEGCVARATFFANGG